MEEHAQRRAEFLILELCDGSYGVELLVAQMLVSGWRSGDLTPSTILDECKLLVENIMDLLEDDSKIWPSLMPGGIPGDAPSMQFAVITMAELARMSGEMNMPLDTGNIQLDYKIKVLFAPGMDTVLSANGAEVFMDEQGVQWIKFYATNGYDAGKEHIVRTDQIVIIRDNGIGDAVHE